MLKKIIIGCLLFSTTYTIAKPNYKGMTRQQAIEAKAEYEQGLLDELKASKYYDTYLVTQLDKLAKNENNLSIPSAQFILGEAYYTGNGLVKNKYESEKWLELAQKAGNLDANKLLYKLYTNENDQKFFDYRKAYKAELNLAKANDLDMMVELAETYRVGRGTKQSYKKHLYWSNKIANYKPTKVDTILEKTKIITPTINETESINNLNDLNEKRTSILKYEEDTKKALEKERNEMNLKIAMGNYNIAKVYYHGLGKAKNMKLAYQNFQKAATLGHLQSQYELARVLTEKTFDQYTMTPMEEAYKWYSVVLENAPLEITRAVTKYQLSKLYANGTGVEMDLQKAAQLKEEAAKGGFAPDIPFVAKNNSNELN